MAKNGAELLDLSGTWQIGDPNPGTPVNVTNPGLDDTPNVPAISWQRLTTLLVLLGSCAGMLTSRLRQRSVGA